MATTVYAASESKPLVETIIILVVACFRTGYIALWRPAVCISTALISSGTIPGPSAHCWRRQQRHEEGELQRWVRLNWIESIRIQQKWYWCGDHWPQQTSARKTSIAKPLKQLMTACSMSRPRLSRAVIVDSRMPGLRAQNMWILTACPSLILTSTWTNKTVMPRSESYESVPLHVSACLNISHKRDDEDLQLINVLTRTVKHSVYECESWSRLR